MAREQVDQIISNLEEPNFKNTIESLDFSGEQLGRVESIFFNLNSAETNEEMQKIAQEISPIISDFKNDISFNEKLFQKVKSVYDKREGLGLTPEQMTLLEKRYKQFTRNGALLDEKAKDRLREVDNEIHACLVACL